MKEEEKKVMMAMVMVIMVVKGRASVEAGEVGLSGSGVRPCAGVESKAQ